MCTLSQCRPTLSIDISPSPSPAQQDASGHRARQSDVGEWGAEGQETQSAAWCARLKCARQAESLLGS